MYLDILHTAIDELEACLAIWGRVFAMRFDLHQKVQTGNSKMLTMFRKNFKRRLERKYQMATLGYVWVREREAAKQQHYHVVIYIDGNKVRHSSALSRITIETWEAHSVGNTVYIPKRCFYHIRDEPTKAEAIRRISYLAKTRGKGNRPNQSKDYGTSRLATIDKTG